MVEGDRAARPTPEAPAPESVLGAEGAAPGDSDSTSLSRVPDVWSVLAASSVSASPDTSSAPTMSFAALWSATSADTSLSIAVATSRSFSCC